MLLCKNMLFLVSPAEYRLIKVKIGLYRYLLQLFIFPIRKITGVICYLEVINGGKMKTEKVLCRVFHLLGLGKPDMGEFKNRISIRKLFICYKHMVFL